MRGRSDHVARQRRFYDTRDHAHLQVRASDFYAEKLAHALADAVALAPEDRVLELGAGFGRFTIPLLARCRALTALDVSPVALARLEQSRDALGIEASRCRAVHADLTDLDSAGLEGRFDVIAGFFLLHHLPDVEATIESLAPWLAPRGRIAFLEPNRRNPLFLVQVAACPDMSWAEEKGMFRLSRARIEAAYRAAGLHDIATRMLGFFPPQILNRSAAMRRLETRLERSRLLRPLLPFLLSTGCAAPPSGAHA